MAANPMPSPPPPSSADALLSERGWLRGLSASLVGHAEADDVAQDAWLALLERQRRGGSNAPIVEPRSWLAGTARRLALASRRKRASQQGHEHMYAGHLAATTGGAHPSVDELAEQAELQGEVVALLLGLDEPIRATLLLRYQGGLTAAEIARRTGAPDGTVRRRIKTGLDHLRAQMDAAHGDRNAWAPALVGVLPAALKTSLASSGSGLAAGAGLLMMKKLMYFAAVALMVGAGWMARSELTGEPSSPSVDLVSRETEPLTQPTDSLVLAAPRVVADSTRDPLPAPAAAPAEPAPRARYSVVNEAGEMIDVSTVLAVIDEEKHGLEPAGGGAFALGEAAAELVAGRASVPLVVSRAGSWPHTFDAPLSDGLHNLVWPKGVQLRGELLERGQRPGEPVRLTLKRDIGWSGRPFAASIDASFDPIPRSISTDDDGRLILSDLPADWRGWLVIKGGWRFEDGSRQSRLIEASGPSAFRLAIQRSPSIIGRVVDGASGNGLAHQMVWVAESRPSARMHMSTKTNERGDFAWYPDARATEVEFRFGVKDSFRTRIIEGVRVPTAGTFDLGDIALESIDSAQLRIVDPNGNPVAGAKVKEQYAQDELESDAGGSLSLPVQSLDKASVEVRADGFEQATYVLSSMSADSATVIELRPELRFTVRVLDQAGEPAPDCQVSFVVTGVHGTGQGLFGAHAPVPTAGTVTRMTSYVDGPHVIGLSTDEDGLIKMVGLPSDMSIQVGFMDGRDWLDAPQIISAGADGGWEGTLTDPRERFPAVSGLVTTETGVPIANANVAFPSSLMASYARTDEDGSFTVPVEWKEGLARLTITATGFATLRHTVELDSLSSSPLVLALEEERPLRVTVVHADGDPVSGARLSAGSPLGDESWSRFGSDSEVTDSNGRCTFTGLRPTELRLAITSNGISYRMIVPADVYEYRFQLQEPATVVADWSALLEQGLEPRHVLLRHPRLEGETVFQRIADDRVDGHDIEAGSADQPSRSFRCAPGEYEVLALTGDSQATVKIVATFKLTANAGEHVHVNLGSSD